MTKKKAYYAHCMALYGSAQEKPDLELIKALGFLAVNPNMKKHQEECKRYRRGKMQYFIDLALGCDLVVFRALPDGCVPSGVFAEISNAVGHGVPVLELPSLALRRKLSVQETVGYLEEIGER